MYSFYPLTTQCIIKRVLTLDQFQYHLPEENIAKNPAEPRDSSRLLVLDRDLGKMSHRHFRDLAEILSDGDVLVRNNTKVVAARLFGKKQKTGGKVELLLNKRLKIDGNQETWEVLTKPGLKTGQVVEFDHTDLTAQCVGITEYTRTVVFNKSKTNFLKILDEIGYTPLPVYIDSHISRQDSNRFKEKYQTIFAKKEGSVAAPTAGLHFTSELDQKLTNKGVEIIELTLHVGLGTFLPVKTKNIVDHPMHSEWFELTDQVVHKLNQLKQSKRRIISVGTTTTRVLEACSSPEGVLKAQSGEVDIFIYPGYKFKFIDGLITNFHLPGSTLLMLVSAFTSVPNSPHTFKDFLSSNIGKAYQNAIKKEYRFYSFGDAMLIW